jgi:hypothetical protein
VAGAPENNALFRANTTRCFRSKFGPKQRVVFELKQRQNNALFQAKATSKQRVVSR